MNLKHYQLDIKGRRLILRLKHIQLKKKQLFPQRAS